MHPGKTVLLVAIVAAPLVALVPQGAPATSPAAARVEAAQKVYEWIDDRAINEGMKDYARMENLATWSRRWAEAEAEGSEPRLAWEHHRDRMKRFVDTVERRHEAGMAGVLEQLMATYFLADADARVAAAK